MTDAGDPPEPPIVGDAVEGASRAVVTPPSPVPAEPVPLVPPKPGDGDWPAQATNAIVDLVDQVRAKTTGPAITAARAVVFGLIVAVLGVVVLVLAIIFAVRLTTEVLELVWDGAGVWLTYLIYGIVLVAVGAIVFSRRHVRGLG